MKKQFLPVLDKAYQILFSKKKKLIGPYMLDLVFFVFFLSVYAVIMIKALPHLVAVMDITGEMGQILIMQMQSGITSDFASKQQSLYDEFLIVTTLVTTVLIIFYALWTLIQGMNFYLTYKIVKRKTKFLRILKNFALINLIFGIVFLLVAYAGIELYSSLQFSIAGIIARPLAISLVSLIFVLFSYLLVVSYSLLDEKKFVLLLQKTFQNSIFNARVNIPKFIVVIALFYIAIRIINHSAGISQGLAVALFLILFIPVMVFNRVLISIDN